MPIKRITDETERFAEENIRDDKKPDADPEKVLQNIMQGIDLFVGGAEQFDDITMLCLKYFGRKK